MEYAFPLAVLLRKDLEKVRELVSEQYNSLNSLDNECYVATGAGDSYAAALAAQYYHSRLNVIDPSDIVFAGIGKEMADRGCTLLALSVGGRTKLVVEAARRYRGYGGRVVAVTASMESPLALVSDEIAALIHGGLAGGIGAGRHLVMLAALARLLGHREPKVIAIKTSCPSSLAKTVYTGLAEGTAAALFSALKVYEVYALPAMWWNLEQLVHAPIYSVKPGTTVVVYGSVLGGEARVKETIETLEKLGYNVIHVQGHGNVVDNTISQALWLLNCLASANDLPPKPRYREHPGLGPLTSLIYHQ